MEADVRDHQQKIAVACASTNTSTTAKADCDAALEAFSDAMVEYQAELKDAQEEVTNENE
jgi:hypothetical protein